MSIEYLNSIWQKTNSALKDQNNFRMPIPYFRQNLDQKIHLDFSTNDYLGLRSDTRIVEAGYRAALCDGAGSGSSRMVIQTDSHLNELEEYFSNAIGLSHSLFFSSGYMANIALFDALSPYPFEESDVSQEIFFDHRCHSSIYLGLRDIKIKKSIFRHLDYIQLEHKLENSCAHAKIIVVESLFSMDGDYANALQLKEICKKHNASLVIDETHSIGVHKAGSYLADNFFLKDHILAIMSGCGKALGVSGGFISTQSFEFKSRLMQKARTLIYSTASSPFVIGALLKSLQIIFSEEGEIRRAHLRRNVLFFKRGLLSFNLEKINIRNDSYDLKEHDSHIFPIIYGENHIALEKVNDLLKKGILVKEIRPPSVPRGTARLRVIIRSDHSENDIEELLENLS